MRIRSPEKLIAGLFVGSIILIIGISYEGYNAFNKITLAEWTFLVGIVAIFTTIYDYIVGVKHD